MANAEDLAIDLIETCTERQIVLVIGRLDDVIGIEAFRYNDCRHCVGVPFRPLCACAQTPCFHSRAHGAGQSAMAGEDILQTLFEQHVDRDSKAAQQRRCRSIGEIALRIGLDHIPIIEKAARQFRRFTCLQCLLTNADDGETRRQHETLLRASHRYVDAPLVHAEVD